LAPIFDRAIELALDRYDPERRQARRELRRARKPRQANKGEVAQDPAEVAFHSAETESEKVSEQTGKKNEKVSEHIEEKKNEKNSGRAREKLCEQNNGQSDEQDNGQGKIQDNGRGRRPDNSQSKEQNQCHSLDAVNGRNERQSSNPSCVTLPRRAGMTSRPKIPQWVRDQVLVRDGRRCTYVGPDGRCPAVTELELDHICPHAQGGSDDMDNLRTLCRAHNQRAAEIVFGVEFVRRCRDEDRSALETNPSIGRAAGAAELEEMSQMESVPV
jgi:5-methylcytosine-specific restriction endonuclease McrA